MAGDLELGALRAVLAGRFGAPLEVHEFIGSTNERAMEWARTGAPEGAVVVADQQTAGRGRRGRSWYSEPGMALMFSLILRPRVAAAQMGLLSAAAGVAVAEGIEGATGIQAGLKWPNDVTVGGRKVAGILVETRSVGGVLEVAVAGAGINVHHPSKGLPEYIAGEATTLAAEIEQYAASPATDVIPAPPAAEIERSDLAGGNPIRAGDTPRAQTEIGSVAAPDRTSLLAAILAAFEHTYDALRAGHHDEVVADASRRSVVLGRVVSVQMPDGRSLQCRALRLLASGALEVEADGEIRALDAGEVERIRAG